MATIRDLRKRLELIKNLKQYTMALEIISATRLKKAKPQAEHSFDFHKRIKSILSNIYFSNPNATHPLLKKRLSIKKKGLIVVAGDKGHCGVYNSGILKEADYFLKNQSKEEMALILIGDQAISHFRHKEWPIMLEIPKWTGKISNEEIHKIAEQCIEWFISEKMDEITIIYTKHYTLLRKDLAVEKFLGISLPEEEGLFSPDPIFEPQPQEIYETLLPVYCFTLLKYILDIAYASELTARNLAMQMATKNAQSLSETVTLLLNKVRQAEITKEALEIATSAIT